MLNDTSTTSKPSTTGALKSSLDRNLDRINETLSKVDDTTRLQIDNLAEGAKISLKTLTERVAFFLDMPQSTVAPFVTMFVKKYDKCTVQKGRNGGIYKGKIPSRAEREHRCPNCQQKLRAKSSTVELRQINGKAG